MARGSRILRIVVIAAIIALGIGYISTFHASYVNSLGDKSLSKISDIYNQNFAKEGNNKQESNDNNNNKQEPKKEEPKKEEPKKDEVKNEEPKKEDSKQQSSSSPSSNGGDLGSYERANATFVTLARNSDLWSIVESIRHVEDRFNNKYHYDWVFLNDDDFNEEFKTVTTNLVSGKTSYGRIPKEHWSFPEWIDTEKAALVREQMKEKKIIYGDSIPYRHMCRFESGFFWRQPALDPYKYYWRVEPGIKLFCNIDYDVFKFMAEKKIKYGFTISLYEYIDTIKTLWDSTKKFIKNEENKKYVNPNNLMEFLSNDNGESYNLCHFWSNFEIADLDFWRSEAYRKYFDFLDHEGGFFYERWGDAPVHSIAAGLFLDKTEVHHFEDIGYYHPPFTHCPTTSDMRAKEQCICNPHDNFAWKGYSCTPKFYNARKLDRPKGWSDYTE